MKSWVERIREAQAYSNAPVDAWQTRLERVRGHTDTGGIERVTSQQLFDVLEIPQKDRSAGSCRRLAAVMRGLGWTSIRLRGLTRGGYREQVRGYARDARHGRSAA